VHAISGESSDDKFDKAFLYQDNIETSTFQFFIIVLQPICYIFKPNPDAPEK
jgi:hypothetical protein